MYTFGTDEPSNFFTRNAEGIRSRETFTLYVSPSKTLGERASPSQLRNRMGAMLIYANAADWNEGING